MKNKLPKIYVADAETDPFKHGTEINPFIWGLYDGNRIELFEDTRDFVKRIKAEKAIVYAHNGGKFDWHFLFEYIEPETEILIINGRIAKLPFGASELRDSMSLFPFALKDYEKEQIDYSKFTKKERVKYMPEIKDYLISDLKNLWNLLYPFIEEYGTKITLASTSYAVWRKISGLKAESNSEFDSIFRQYYFGGRVQDVKRGYYNRSIFSYDIVSAYPFAMLSNHPWGNIPFASNKLPELEEEIQRSFITLTCKSIGAFPIKNKKNELLFPDDGKERQFNVSGWEFLEAKLEKYEIQKVYTLSDSINFQSYIHKFFKAKKEAKERGDKNGELYNKLLLNSLYGKFASNFDKYKQQRIIHQENIQAYINQGWEYCNEIGSKTGLVERELLDSQKYWKNVAVGASITGFVRAFLWKHAKPIWKHLIYMDTDNLKTLIPAKHLKIGSNLGNWKFEGEYTEGAIAMKKFYALKYKEPKVGDDGKAIWWHTASKGIKVTAKQICDLVKRKITSVRYRSEAPTFSVKRGKIYIDRKVKIKDTPTL